MVKSVLIIGQYPDPHIDKVLPYLTDGEVRPLVFQRHSKKDQLSLEFSHLLQPTLKINKSIRNLVSVWWRLKPYMPAEFSGGLSNITENFIVKEWGEVLKSLPYFTRENIKWINNIEKHYKTSYKAFQLITAQKLGLTIPPTLISNSPADIKRFFDRHSKVIYKTLSSFIMPPKYVIFTTLLNKDDILKSGNELIIAPGIYQAYCEKEYELRVTVVENKVFTARINSQQQKETEVDWRKNQFLEIYTPWELTKDTQRKLLKFHTTCGLIYAAYDFIVTDKGEEIFLECNPGGQWLWVEEATGFPISEALARSLIHA